MIDPVWAIMPVLAGPEFTEAAISDVLAQSIPTRLLIINQGVDDAFRDRLERLAEQESARVFVWHHQPPLPSLSASWNLALDTVWRSGGAEVALVVNNDVRLRPDTVQWLAGILAGEQALFVSAVGVTAEQFAESRGSILPPTKGGPDFSCFLISRACHTQFRFDERFVPAFCEDLDYHRRLMLAGEGARIFSVNLPYLHYASQTLKALPEKEAQRIRQQIESVSRAYYAKKWGGPVNAETFWRPFDGDHDEHPIPGYFPAPETPNLFDTIRGLWMGEDPRVLRRPNDRQILEEADPGDRSDTLNIFTEALNDGDPQLAAERWADSNQQEDERGEEDRGSAPDRPAADPPDADRPAEHRVVPVPAGDR